MSEEVKNTNINEPPTNSTPEDKGGLGGEKMFTQEEVNRIVSERLNREREKLTQPPQEDEREKALKAREARLDCRDYLDGKKYPAALLDILNTDDVEKFKTAADAFAKAFPDVVTSSGPTIINTSGKHSGSSANNDPLAAAFKPPQI